MTHLGLLPLLAPARQDVEGLAERVEPLPAETTCQQVDELFLASPSRAGLLVRDARHPGRVGLVVRPHFLQAMAGRYGFGRALYARTPVGALAQWDPVVLDAASTVQQAATALLQRPAAARYDELVVRFGEGGWGTLSAATVLEALSRSLADLALYDGLTGLANRGTLLAELEQRCAAPAAGTALLFIDLDRFKQVNDAHGHNAGDQLLQAVAQRLRDTARPYDLVARLGGDEFAVLLSALPAGTAAATAAQAVAERLLATLSRPLDVAGHTVRVGANIGVATATTGTDPDTLLREADLAMYRAKSGGGDRVHAVTAVGGSFGSPLLTLGIDGTLEQALAEEQFVLHYQPIVDLETGRRASTEALLRWQHPQQGLLGPGAFLPAAEASGLIVEIDRWVLRAACDQLVRWDTGLAADAPTWVNVNVSRPHLAHPDLVSHVRAALADSGLAPHRLRLELPETATRGDLVAATAALADLRDLGVKLTLDDLGAGSSTLRHLSELPLDGVKIDRSFIGRMLTHERDAAIVRVLIDLAHDLDLKVTAEGIESRAQLDALRTWGCTHGQGFYLGRPEPAGGTGGSPVRSARRAGARSGR